MHVSRETHRRPTARSAIACLLASSACSEPPPAPPPPPAPIAHAQISAAEILADADARTLTDRIRASIAAPEPQLRQSAVSALVRLRDPTVAPLLVAALRDPDPEVRDRASLGLGGLEASAPEGVPAALLGALVAEPDPERRAHLLEDGGRIASDELLAAYPSALAADHPLERRGACRGLGAAGLRGRTIEPDLVRRISERVVVDSSPAVRLACAYALTRLPAPSEPSALAEVGNRLVRGTADPDADVRAMAYRALARYPGASADRIAEGTRDPDWPVAVHAFRALAAIALREHRATELARELAAAIDTLLASGDVAPGGPVHVALAALEACAPLAREPAIHAAAEQALSRLGRVPAEVPATRDRGLVHCAAARLVDLGRGWPSRVLGCGLEQISETERRVLAATVLGALEGADAQRVAYLEQRLLGDPRPIVRQAVLGALGAIDEPRALEHLLQAIRAETDIGVRIAALEGLRAMHARRSGRLAAQLLAGSAADDRWPEEAIAAAMRQAGDAIASDDLEGLVTWLGVGAAVAPRHLVERAIALAAHSNPAVRQAARELLGAAGAEPPVMPVAPPPSPLSAAELASVPAARAVIETDRGRFVIALRPDLAPSTVLRFTRLARAGFFDGLTFHRVVPAFVVQGGDPRGDGYGGPGWSQRCEDHRLPYERGTVGMALAGRDTGGSQFFVTLAPQPHLDLRYTAFGQVSEGIEVVERLQAGDQIRRVRIE